MGIKFKCEIKGLNNLEKKINKIITELPKTVEKGIEEVLKNIQQTAIKIEYGHNSEGILIELVGVAGNKIKGRIYTSKETFKHAMFEHFGTGQYAEMPHIGTTKTFIESGYMYWFIPINKVEKPLHYKIITIQGQEFYLAHGVKANHFMTDAEFETRNDNIEEIKQCIFKMIKEVCK